MLVLPTMTAPAWRSRATIGASRGAGGASRSAVDPAVVASPATSKRSLIEIGMPASLPPSIAAFRNPSCASAAARACSAYIRRKARLPSPAGSAIRPSASSTSARLLVRPSRSKAVSSITVGCLEACPVMVSFLSRDPLRPSLGVYATVVRRSPISPLPLSPLIDINNDNGLYTSHGSSAFPNGGDDLPYGAIRRGLRRVEARHHVGRTCRRRGTDRARPRRSLRVQPRSRPRGASAVAGGRPGPTSGASGNTGFRLHHRRGGRDVSHAPFDRVPWGRTRAPTAEWHSRCRARIAPRCDGGGGRR